MRGDVHAGRPVHTQALLNKSYRTIVVADTMRARKILARTQQLAQARGNPTMEHSQYDCRRNAPTKHLLVEFGAYLAQLTLL